MGSMITKSNESFIIGLKDKYNNGQLISEKEWQKLLDGARSKDAIVEKTGYLKEAALTEAFLGADIDEFILLTAQKNTMYTAFLDMEEYLLFILNGENKSVLESTEEAAKVLENIFLKLIELKTQQKTYLAE